METFKENMSELSRDMYVNATKEDMTADKMVRYLEENARFRTIPLKILKCYLKAHPEERADTAEQEETLCRELKKRITEGLKEHHPESNGDSIRRKIANWFRDRVDILTDRQTVFECCFLLNLTLEASDDLLAYLTEEGIHWRELRDIVYGYALKEGLSFAEAEELMRRAEEVTFVPDEGKSEDPESDKTVLVWDHVMKADGQQDFLSKLAEDRFMLGEYHNYAYVLFTGWMNDLQTGENDEKVKESETLIKLRTRDKLSITELLRTYMLKTVVDRAKDRDRDIQDAFVLDTVRSRILQRWPNEDALLDMKKRRRDVDRKTIILLFLATTDSIDEFDYSRDTLFEELYQSLNDTLEDCGFCPLDPRAPFDWFILYLLCADDLLNLDSRMRKLFEAVFPPAAGAESDS